MKKIDTVSDEDMAELMSPEFDKDLKKYKKKMGFTFEQAENDARAKYMEKYGVIPNKITKSPTKKEVKKLIKEVEAGPLPKKIKTGKVKKLLKAVESKAVEHEGNQLIKKIGTKLKKAKDISDIKQMIKQSEETKPNYISIDEVNKTIKDMEYFIASKKLTKEEVSHAKKKSKMIADKMKSDPSIIPILRGTLLNYNYAIIHRFYTDYPELFKELYPDKPPNLEAHKANFIESKTPKTKKAKVMKKIQSTEEVEAKKKAKEEKAAALKAEKIALKEKFSKTRGMTPEEIKKFNQAKAYITRITNKTSGKHKDLNLDKDDIANIARDIAYTGFTRMSEPLFLQSYKEYMDA